MATNIQRNFERAETKDAVDKAQDAAESELNNMSRFRRGVIESVYNLHVDRLEGNDFVQELRDTITTEVSLLFEQIVSYADNKKAQLDAAAATRAKEVLDNAKGRASAFSKTILIIEKDIEFKMNQLLAETEVSARVAKQQAIDKLELSLEEQKNR